MTLYAGPIAADLNHIPAALKEWRQWVLWRGAEKIDEQTGEIKLNKIPIDPHTLRNADTTDPMTWGSYEHCVEALPVALEGWEHDNPAAYHGGGLGFVFSAEDPYAGIDLDKCRNPETGDIDAWAKKRIEDLDSYTETTPSSTGVHILVEGSLTASGRKKGHVETYDQMRFFTMTGWHLPGTPPTIEPRQEMLTAFHTAVFGRKKRPQTSERTSTIAAAVDDTVLFEKARAAKNGPKFTALWTGDTSAHDHDDSSADLALCCMLAFWTQDPAQIDRLFRQSELIRDKWDEQRGAQTYGERTITEALARQTEHYRYRRQSASQRAPSDNGEAPLDESIYGPATARDPDALPYSDYTNALALVRAHGKTLRYCFPWRSWLVWTGSHWRRDESGTVMRHAKQTIKRLARHAEDLDDGEAVKLLRHVKSSLATMKLKAMIESAQSEDGIPVQPEDLDKSKWLLNVRNGTLDLQTGILRPHAQTDLLTKCLSTPCDPDATCPTWERFLWRIMGGTDPAQDSEDAPVLVLEERYHADERAHRLIAYLQRAIGYTLTGQTREQCLFLLHGTGANGKSTFLEILQALLEEYAQSTPSASLLAKSRPDGIPNDIARLRGARLVSAVEIGEGRRLNEELVKRLTGQDTLTARFLFAEFFDFTPEFKLFIACNHLPHIQGTDHAIWRRIQRIPFTVTIPEDEQDKDLPQKLKAELPGILAWALRGCLTWVHKGLMPPEEVIAATAEYRTSMDVIGRFIDECCLVNPQVRVKASALYDAYKHWCEETRESPITMTAFGSRMEDRGFTRDKTGIVWRVGIGLPATTEQS